MKPGGGFRTRGGRYPAQGRKFSDARTHRRTLGSSNVDDYFNLTLFRSGAGAETRLSNEVLNIFLSLSKLKVHFCKANTEKSRFLKFDSLQLQNPL